MGSGFFSQDNPEPIEQSPAGPGPGNIVVQEPTGVDGPTASFFGRGASPELQAFEQDAKQYAEEAAASAAAADTSAGQAETYKIEAASQALAADNSAGAALASQNAAATSATNAAGSANSASSSASDAAASAVNAASSAYASASSATASSGSASSSASSATNAANSASAASTSAADAANSASAASASASAASASATDAGSSATAASASATSASGSATTATTKAGEADTSATNAANSASAASTSASNAATSASSASTSASAAATSASAADTAKTAAQAAQAAAEAVYDDFDDRYLGPKASAPTVDNDGNALQTGALYFNTATDAMQVWTGSAWQGFGGLTNTDGLTEGTTNLYFTNARARSSVSASGSLSYNSTTGVFSYTQPTAVSTFTNDAGYLTNVTSITGGIETPDYVKFDTAATVTPAVGQLSWNDTDGTLEFGLKGGNVVLQIGQEQLLRATNSTGSTISNGQVVYINGSTGNHVNVTLAQANSESTSSKTLGVVTELIAHSQSGFVTTSGLVRGLDTSALTEGAAVWLSATVAGGLTTTRPTAPNHAVLIGWCVKSHASVGVIFVHVANGYELDELHDVLISSKTDKDFLAYEGSSGLWKNKSISAVLGYTPVNPASLATVATSGAYADLSGKPTNVSSFTNDAGYLTSFTEADPVFSASAAAGITSGNISNWNTAYGWGNHASAGYLTSATAASTYQPLDGDLTAIAGLAGTSGLLKKTAANTWTLDTSSYLTSYTETDPVFVASAAYGITATNISNWNTAYSWGNHASAGYLTSSAIGSTVQGYDADLGAIAALSGTTGLLKKTAANTWTLDTSTYLTGITSGQVTTALGYTPYSNAGGTISGNVGIGAASSGSLLEIRKDQNADTIAKVINSNTGVNATARLDFATGTANAYCIFALKDNGGSPYVLMSSGSAITAMYHDMASHIFRSQAGTEWLRIEATTGTLLSAPTYNNTAAGSTVVVTSTGQIRRTSSSIKYKKDVENLDPTLATNAINNLRPVWYRTKNPEGDDKATWSHIGLIAEEVHEVEPRLVRYRTAEVIDEQKPVLDEAGDPVLDEEGNPTFTTERVERELAVPEPEDVDYARLSVLLLAKVKELETRLAALEAA